MLSIFKKCNDVDMQTWLVFTILYIYTVIGKAIMKPVSYVPGPYTPVPLFLESVRAGFPSPAQDYVEKTLDLNELCIRLPC